MIGRVLYTAAFFFFLIYTIYSQPTDKAEGVGEDFIRGGQDKTPTQKTAIYRFKKKKKRNSFERTVVKADTPAVTVTKGNEKYSAP
jgi:predicted HTH transcriptional regulator